MHLKVSVQDDFMNKISTCKMLCIVFLGIILSAGYVPVPLLFAAPAAEEKIESWADIHPRAAAELGEWVNTYKEAAQAIFRWDFLYPDQTKIFVAWSNTHQGKGVEVFAAEHTDWNRFNRITREHRAAVGSFIVWCRFHPKASLTLMQHPRALHWVGKNLYKYITKAKEG